MRSARRSPFRGQRRRPPDGQRPARRARWHTALKLDAPDPGIDGFEDHAVRGADVRRGVAELSHYHRMAIVLHYCIDLPLEEVAAATGVPLGTVKSTIHRAAAALRARLVSEEVLT